MNATALRAVSGLAALVGLGVAVQIYLIAAYIFGAGDGALDAHKGVGHGTLVVEVVVLIIGVAALRADRRLLGMTVALPIVGLVQIAFSGGDSWLGAVHGVLALAVLGLAGIVHLTAMRAARGVTS